MRPRIHPLVPIGLGLGLGLIGGLNALGINPAKILPKGPSPEDRLKAEIKQVGPEFPGVFEVAIKAPTCQYKIFNPNGNVVKTTTQPLAFNYRNQTSRPVSLLSGTYTTDETWVTGIASNILTKVDEAKTDINANALTFCLGSASKAAKTLQVDNRSQAPFQGVASVSQPAELTYHKIIRP
jgi:hypothetical protein